MEQPLAEEQELAQASQSEYSTTTALPLASVKKSVGGEYSWQADWELMEEWLSPSALEEFAVQGNGRH